MPEIQMPKLSDTMTEGTLIAWKKKKGDKVSVGEVIAEIETDKATMEWESPEDGTLIEIFIEEGDKVNVGDKIAFIGDEREGVSTGQGEKAKASDSTVERKQAVQKFEDSARETKSGISEKTELEEEQPDQVPVKKSGVLAFPEKSRPREMGTLTTEDARVRASPVARRLAAELGIVLSSVTGTGPDGRVTETDIRAAAKSKGIVSPAVDHGGIGKPGSASLVKAKGGVRITLSGMRKTIAQRLVESLGPVPHFYLNIEIDGGPLVLARAELKSAGEGADASRITVNDLVLKAAVDAAVKVPKVNASFDDGAIVQFDDVDLAVAVAIEDGLVTPVIRAAQTKSLREISETVRDFAYRARNKRMKPDEFQGGTFTVSNLGGYGIDNFSAIINPPQGFILSIGALTRKPVTENPDRIVVGHRMSIGMSCDHRIIDGALGAKYLKELRHFLENPALLLV